MWTSNPNQFVEDEDDDTFSFSVRIAAQDVLLVSEEISVTHTVKPRYNFTALLTYIVSLYQGSTVRVCIE